MPIGKDSITKRVAKIETSAPVAEDQVKAEAPVTATEPEKAVAPKKSTPKKTTTKKSTAKTVIANIAPETVKAVIGHEENSGFEKIEIGSELPYYLL